MKCLKCGGDTRVDESRSNGYIRIRARICKRCGYAFTTKEEPVDRGEETIPRYLNRVLYEMQRSEESRDMF